MFVRMSESAPLRAKRIEKLRIQAIDNWQRKDKVQLVKLANILDKSGHDASWSDADDV